MSFKGTEIYRKRTKNIDAIPMPMPLYRQDITALCDQIDEQDKENAELREKMKTYFRDAVAQQERGDEVERANLGLRERVAELEGALADALGVAYWMSGSNDFSPGGIAYEGWGRMNVKLTAARDVLYPKQEGEA